jgi:THO complex subunit 2
MALSAIRCQYVTEDCIREWKSTNSARKLAISVTPSRFVFELCQTVVRGELPITKCRVALDAVHLAEPLTKEETASLLVDTIAHLGQEVHN